MTSSAQPAPNYFLGKRSAFSHVAGSSMIFISVVNAALGGLLVATIAGALAAPTVLVVVAGFTYGLAYFVISSERGRLSYQRTWDKNTPLNPTPTE